MKNESGLTVIENEYKEQRDAHGYEEDGDDTYIDGQLAKAAACYAAPFGFRILTRSEGRKWIPRFWPWNAEFWKPSPDNRIKELAKAGALIVCEIERLQRLQQKTNHDVSGD